MREGLWGPRPGEQSVGGKGTEGKGCGEDGEKERVKRRTDGRRRWEKRGGGGAGCRDGELAEEEPRAEGREGFERRGGRAGTGEPRFDRRREGGSVSRRRGDGDGVSGGPRSGGVREQLCPALPAAGPHHGQRRLQAQLQEGGDPAHHQDSGEGRHLGWGARGPRHLGSRRPEGPLTPGPARDTPGAPVRGPRAGPCVWGRGRGCWGPAGPGLRSRPALARISQRGRARRPGAGGA